MFRFPPSVPPNRWRIELIQRDLSDPGKAGCESQPCESSFRAQESGRPHKGQEHTRIGFILREKSNDIFASRRHRIEDRPEPLLNYPLYSWE